MHCAALHEALGAAKVVNWSVPDPINGIGDQHWNTHNFEYIRMKTNEITYHSVKFMKLQ